MADENCEHNWSWLKTKRIGHATIGPEDMYYCAKCMGQEWASDIGKPTLRP